MNYKTVNNCPESYRPADNPYCDRYYAQYRNCEPFPLQFNTEQYYTQPDTMAYAPKEMIPADYGLWVNNSLPSPLDSGFNGYFESPHSNIPHSAMQQVPPSISPYSPEMWNIQQCYNDSSFFNPQSPPTYKPLVTVQPVTDTAVVSEEEKKSSTLWRMLSEVDSMEELAVNMTGTRPLTELRAEDILEFERSDNTNVSMPTDKLILNFAKENASSFRV